MARNTTTEATSTNAPARRKFGVSTKGIPTAMPHIVDGIYVGNVKNIKVDGLDKMMANYLEVEDLKLFDVVQEISGKSTDKKYGGYTIRGVLTYQAELPNERNEGKLPTDNFTVSNGRVNIFFAKDEEGNWGLDNSIDDYGIKNREISNFCKALGVTDEELDTLLEATSFDEDEEVVVPTRLEDVADASEMLQACNFYRAFYSLLAEHVSGKEVKVNVATRAQRDDTLTNDIKYILPLE